MGSCVFNLSLIALMDMLHGTQPIFSRAEHSHILSAGFGVILMGIATFSVTAATELPSFGHISFSTPLIIGLHALSMHWLGRARAYSCLSREHLSFVSAARAGIVGRMVIVPDLTVRCRIRKRVAVRGAVIKLDNLLEYGYYFTTMITRGKFINILVLSIYIFHVLFPLLYSTGSANAEAADYAYASPSTVQRSILEQNLLLVTSGEQDSDSPSAPAAHILLKKKRAIAPSSKEIVPKLILQFAKFTDFEPSLKIAVVFQQIPFDTLNCPNGFPYYHSGISPPSA